MAARARGYKRIERIAIVVSGVAIPMFAVSYLELRRLDDAVLAGGTMGVPYFAYSAIALFLGGTAVLFLMRHLIANISRALAAEQKRRWMEDGAPAGEADVSDATRVSDDVPAQAG
jgi:hypothetical protein